MRIFTRVSVSLFATSITIGLAGFPAFFASAATTPSLGVADSFALLANSYNNSSTFTSITGDVGYQTGPSVVPPVTGTIHMGDATFTQAVNDQNTALSALNSQACTFTFAAGTIDLATDTTHGPAGV